MASTSATLEVSIGSTRHDQSFLAAWKSIEASADHEFFLGHTWMSAWVQAARPDGEWYLVTLAGRPVAAAIISRPTRRWPNPLRSRYSMHETGTERIDGLFIEYNGILAQPEFALGSLKEIIGALRQKLNTTLNRLSPAELIVSAASPAFTRLMQTAFPDTRIFKKEQSPFVALGRLRAENRTHISALSANTRAQLRQARRNMEARGTLELERASTTLQAHEFLNELKPLHIARWLKAGKSSAFDNPAFEPFLMALIGTGVANGSVDVLRASAGGMPFGYLVNFRHRGTHLNYTSGFAYEAFADLKPGIVSHLLAIDDADKSGGTSYNFLAGAARYKSSLSTNSDELCWLKLQL